MRLILLFLFLGSTMAGDLIPTERRVTWQGNVGISGGIPSRTTVYTMLAPSGGDDVSAINAAIQACPDDQVVLLTNGTFLVQAKVSGQSYAILINKSVVLRGMGPTTILQSSITNSHDVVLMRFNSDSSGTTRTITAGYTKGSTSLTVDDATSISVGNYVIIWQDNPAYVTPIGAGGTETWGGENDPDHVMKQINKVTNVAGNVITVEIPLYIDMSNNPKLATKPLGTGRGLEDLAIVRTVSTAYGGNNVTALRLADSWVKGVYSTNGPANHFQFRTTYRCEMRECVAYDGIRHDSGKAYGVQVFNRNSALLIEDNIFYKCRHSVVFEGGGCGSVVGYNYMVGVYSDPDQDWLSGDIVTHGAHPYMNLFEGNVCGKIYHDRVWGSASHNTSYRNHIVNNSRTLDTPVIGRFGYVVDKSNYTNNAVGLVIGVTGDTVTWKIGQNGQTPSQKSSYRFGFETTGSSTLSDTNVEPSTIIHGSYDFGSDTVTWDGSIAETNLIDSFYLTGKPSFYAVDEYWPSVGPDIETQWNPAVFRFDGTAQSYDPTISAISNQSLSKNGSLVVPFTVGDDLDSPGDLTVTRATSNTTVLPLANCVLGGSGANRTITLTPATDQTGTSTITITVEDSGGRTAQEQFDAIVTAQSPNSAGGGRVVFWRRGR